MARRLRKPKPPPVPRHIAIVMDGNGRWAKERGWARTRGHEAGVESVRKVCEACRDFGVQQLTLYAFSTENWSRPKREVEFLWRLLRRFLIKERQRLAENNIRFRTIGRTHDLPKYVRDEIKLTEESSRMHDGTTLCLALNSGSKAELVDAIQALAEDVLSGELRPEQISPHSVDSHLYTAGMPPLDLVIRTAGEHRLSNFLLWQAAYAELYFSEVYWPDFRKDHLRRAIEAFGKRERRYGGLGAR
jgi:undecaprenyl diphosphate synthase